MTVYGFQRLYLGRKRNGTRMKQTLQSYLIDFIMENQKKYYRIAYCYVKNKETALDIVQNTIVKVLENQDSLRKKRAAKTWIYQILIHECLNELRKTKREIPCEPEQLGEDFYKEKFYDGEEEVLFEAINILPEKQKTVILLHYYEYLTLKEIAAITETNLSTVKTRLYSGLKKLKTILKEEIE
ncbi:RNA polymerase sigma factor [Velocimicrobium porci]|nr:RNA polymerase sigma factor [Velocimicrobium porci]